MSVWYDKRPLGLHGFPITAVRYFGILGVEIVKLVKPHVCTVSNLGLLYVQYLIMLCRFSCFELLKFSYSALRFINVGVSAHCVPSSKIFISHSAEVAKMQHSVYIIFHRNCENATSKFCEFWYQYTKRHINNKQLI